MSNSLRTSRFRPIHVRKNSNPLLPFGNCESPSSMSREQSPRISAMLDKTRLTFVASSSTAFCDGIPIQGDRRYATSHWIPCTVMCLLFLGMMAGMLKVGFEGLAIAAGDRLASIEAPDIAEAPAAGYSRKRSPDTMYSGFGVFDGRLPLDPPFNLAGRAADIHHSSSPHIVKQLYAGLFKMLATDIEGHPRTLSDYAGKVTLVVNVAATVSDVPHSAANYRALQYLQDKYRPLGFEVLAFPSGDFGDNDGSNTAVFASAKQFYAVNFRMFQKTSVNGQRSHPVYKFLKRELVDSGDSALGGDWDLKGNFQKFLVNRYGIPVALYSESQNLKELEGAILELLKEPSPFHPDVTPPVSVGSRRHR